MRLLFLTLLLFATQYENGHVSTDGGYEPVEIWIEYPINNLAVRLSLENIKVIEKNKYVELKLEVTTSWNMSTYECDRTSEMILLKQLPPLRASTTRTISAHNLDGFDLPYLRFREASAVRPLSKNDRTLTLKRASNDVCWARYVVRYSLLIACPMVFNNFPADEHMCHINIQHDSEETYTETSRYLIWEKKNPIILLPTFKHSEFDLEASKAKFRQHWSPTASKVRGGLGLRLRLTRRLPAQLLQTYAPSGLLVALSWLGFWLRGLSERLSLCCLLLLALCAQISQLRRTMPPCSGLTGVDVWMFSCLAFVFAALIVFAVSHNIVLRRSNRNASSAGNQRHNHE